MQTNSVNATQVQAQTSGAANYSVLTALMQASFVVQIVILILVSLSILCWAIAWTKFREFKDLRESNEAFTSIFWKSTSLDDVFQKISVYVQSPCARLFKEAYTEMKKISESPLLNSSKNSIDQANNENPQMTGLDNLERTLRQSTENEISKMESKLTVLASTGSTGPFIGLFGTVWGIMSSFEQIAKTGSASLAAVAPGISEALITTAIGLAAAIPAVIIYNHFIAEIKREEMLLNNFSGDFLNVLKRNFFKQ